MADAAVAAIADALEAEEQALDDIVATLDAAAWATPTPAAGWDVQDQIGHLALSEEWATLATTDPDGFGAFLDGAIEDLDRFAKDGERQVRDRSPAAVLAWWRTRRAETLAAVRAQPDGSRIPWFGPPMGARSFLTARLMETWAHGQDVRDALGAEPCVSARLRDIAHLGVATRAFAYANRGHDAPDAAVSVTLVGPDGDRWQWGAADAPDRISGPALDWCLVVTQRRSVADTDLEVMGEAARDWMEIVQAFAGPPTDPPSARG